MKYIKYIIIVIISVSIGFAFGMLVEFNYNKDIDMFYAEIKDIRDNEIFVEGDYFLGTKYDVVTYELIIKNRTKIFFRGSKIDISELKVGDKILVKYKGGITTSIPSIVSDVKEIRLIEKD